MVPSSRGVHRVVVILTVWIALVVAGATAYVIVEGEAAEAYGRVRYIHRDTLERQINRTADSKPRVVWMGDSTVLGLRTRSYPQLLGGVLPHTTSTVMGFIGSDFFTYYPVVAALLERHRPNVLVIVAHLRLFAPPAASASRTDLVSLIPTTELLQAMQLPFESRGVTIPRLLLTRLLRYPLMERAIYVGDGARARISETDASEGKPGDLAVRSLSLVGTALRESDVGISRTHPTVRMLEATVALAHEQGVRVVIVGTPLPVDNMRATFGYDEAVYRARFETLRAVVEGAGGRFVDLHDALPARMFQDAVGHFTEEGAALLAGRIRPVVAQELTSSMTRP